MKAFKLYASLMFLAPDYTAAAFHNMVVNIVYVCCNIVLYAICMLNTNISTKGLDI